VAVVGTCTQQEAAISKRTRRLSSLPLPVETSRDDALRPEEILPRSGAGSAAYAGVMAFGIRKTEHVGGKNGGGGAWGYRADVKRASDRVRRADDRKVVEEDWGDDEPSTP